MPTMVRMPQLGATMTEGKLVEWLAQEGENVSKGQPIARIETDKIVAEVEAPTDGILSGIAVWPEEMIAVTGLLAWIVVPGEAAPVAGPAPAASPRQAAPTSGALPTHATSQTLARTTVPAVVTLFAEADATELCRLQAELATMLQSPVGYDECFIKIVAQALQGLPTVNARLTEEGVEQLRDIDIGVALGSEQRSQEFAVLSADRRSLLDIHRELQCPTESGRRLASHSMAQVGFQISHLGPWGVGRYTPLVPRAQAAALGIGEIAAQVVAASGTLAVREMVSLSLSFDHRLVDSGVAARLLQRVVQLIEEPYGLWA